MAKVFIDGSAGTTGLRLQSRLSARDDVELITLPEELRKDANARRDALAAADVAFLCLPDAAAVESAQLAADKTIVIDTSTAHRVNDDWAYGFAELTGQREKIAASKRIANPGCHASGFISLVRPLTEHGIIAKDARLSCVSLTGYSGGGKKMIADYENSENEEALRAPRMYGITQAHKHLPEMVKQCMLENAPVFMPIVSSYYAGMEVTVPVFASELRGSTEDIKEIYKAYYKGKLVKFVENADENGFLSASSRQGRDDMEISVSGSAERILLTARFDNLGKGASGAAIQNMNIALGLDETYGLVVEKE